MRIQRRPYSIKVRLCEAYWCITWCVLCVTHTHTHTHQAMRLQTVVGSCYISALIQTTEAGGTVMLESQGTCPRVTGEKINAWLSSTQWFGILKPAFMDGIPKSSISFNERFNFNEYSQCSGRFSVNCVLSSLCHYPLLLTCFANPMSVSPSTRCPLGKAFLWLYCLGEE